MGVSSLFCKKKARKQILSNKMAVAYRSRSKNWSTEEIEQLIEVVRENRYIYDPKEKSHKDAQKSANFWATVALKFAKEGKNIWKEHYCFCLYSGGHQGYFAAERRRKFGNTRCGICFTAYGNFCRTAPHRTANLTYGNVA